MEKQLIFRIRHLIAGAPKRPDAIMHHFPQNLAGGILDDIGRTKINNLFRMNGEYGRILIAIRENINPLFEFKHFLPRISNFVPRFVFDKEIIGNG